MTAGKVGEGAKAIYQAVQQTKIMAPSSDCVVPIGEEQLEKALRQVPADKIGRPGQKNFHGPNYNLTLPTKRHRLPTNRSKRSLVK